MARVILIVDVPHLCYRALHAHPDLSHNGIRTGVVYGTLRDLLDLKLSFCADVVAFCFDSRQSRRKELYPEYKAGRHEHYSAEDEAIWRDMHRQILDIRVKYLPRAGFANVLIANGYEADDIAASLVLFGEVKPEDTVILVTGDHDWFQLIRPNVMVYDMRSRKRETWQSFHRRTGGIPPTKYCEVMAMSGCKTDNIPGVGGVGEFRAFAYMRGELEKKSAAYKSITSAKGCKIIANNLKLVRLPLEGTPIFELQDDNFDIHGWRSVCDELGMRSLRDYPMQ